MSSADVYGQFVIFYALELFRRPGITVCVYVQYASGAYRSAAATPLPFELTLLLLLVVVRHRRLRRLVSAAGRRLVIPSVVVKVTRFRSRGRGGVRRRLELVLVRLRSTLVTAGNAIGVRNVASTVGAVVAIVTVDLFYTTADAVPMVVMVAIIVVARRRDMRLQRRLD